MEEPTAAMLEEGKGEGECSGGEKSRSELRRCRHPLDSDGARDRRRKSEQRRRHCRRLDRSGGIGRPEVQLLPLRQRRQRNNGGNCETTAALTRGRRQPAISAEEGYEEERESSESRVRVEREEGCVLCGVVLQKGDMGLENGLEDLGWAGSFSDGLIGFKLRDGPGSTYYWASVHGKIGLN